MKKGQGFKKIINSLRFQILVLVVVVGLLPTAVLFTLYNNLYVSQSVESDVSEIVPQGEVVISQIISSGYLNNTEQENINTLLQALGNTYGGRIMVVNSSLNIVKDTYKIDEGKTAISPEIIQVMNGKYAYFYDKSNSDLFVAVPIISTFSGEELVVGALIINKSMNYINTNLDYFFNVEIVFGLVWSVLVIIAGIYFSERVGRPFTKFSKSLKDIEDGISDSDIHVNNFSEMGALSEQMNSLLNRMKVVDESRQEFVSNVSHELKTPLTSMKVLADSLNSMEDVPNELYKEFMLDIGDEIDRETQIINDLLTLVKMDKGARESLNISSVNMNELIELIMKRLKPIAEKQNIELVFESFRPVVAEVDKVKMTLAITNLIENGIKYNKETGWVHVSINSDHQFCYIKVQDCGIGMPKESIEHIFERFYRVDKSHSREIGGTGLGLAITKSSIVMHRGDIKVHSVEGEGTTFDVRIPLNYIEEAE
ncbi:MAG: ATP-binding protein [Lachnospiraceae bacterium]|nr:ATP-binding protein [Lachnospiraceae bacterium]